MIESAKNQQIKHIIHIKKSSKYRREHKIFLVEGRKMVEEAIAYHHIEKIYAVEDYNLDSMELGDVPVEVVTSQVLKQLSDTMNPQGILALVRMPEYNLAEYLTKEDSCFLCLEGINDPGNLGTMMRTAEGAGMTGIIMSKDTVDLFNPKVVRATMGAMFREPFFIVEDFVETMAYMRQGGYSLYAAHLQGKSEYTQMDCKGKMGILIGNEANGLTEKVSELANQKVIIPMEGQLESLNAAVSAAILMYEAHRKRKED